MQFEIDSKNLVALDGSEFSEVLRGSKRIEFFIEESLNFSRITRKLKNAKKVIISVKGTKNTTYRDTQKLAETASMQAKKNAKIVWDYSFSKKNKMLIVAGW